MYTLQVYGYILHSVELSKEQLQKFKEGESIAVFFDNLHLLTTPDVIDNSIRICTLLTKTFDYIIPSEYPKTLKEQLRITEKLINANLDFIDRFNGFGLEYKENCIALTYQESLGK